MRKVHLIGNAHLDPVWLWQWQEGFAEIKATFRSALDRMNEFPEYKFTSACSAYYMWIEKSDKAMFDEIVRRVREGRWCIVGGWMIQPDCNVPCGESFARHSLISQRYFKEKFGVIATTGYNVDSFGHNGNIPMILRNSGMKSYVFMRPMKHEKELPQSLFTWEGVDGSRVNTYRIPMYYNIKNDWFDTFEKIADMEPDHDMMAFYGVGNHGGGPTIQLLDRMTKELDDRFEFSTPDTYFEHAENLELPVVSGDLQYHAKGCYSACTQIKSDNRTCENAMLSTEKLSALSRELIGTDYPSDEFRRAWEDVLFNQFHDILGGCCIREAYQDAKYLHGEAMAIAERCKNFALQQISWNIDTMDGKELKAYAPNENSGLWTASENIGTPVVVFNPLDHAVSGMVVLRKKLRYMKDDQGNDIVIQSVRDSKTDGNDKYAVAFLAEVPALGYRVYRMYNDTEYELKEVVNPLIVDDTMMENEYLRVTMNPATGEIASIYDKAAQRELLSGDTSTVLIDDTKHDTWAHGINEFKTVAGVFSEGSVHMIEQGPLRVALRSVMRYDTTEIVRDYFLTVGSKAIVVKTKIDFHEKHRMLKLRFPMVAESPRAYCEIPFGYIERATDGSEQTGGAWTALVENGYGLGIANDSKYSFDVDGCSMALTVLRSALYADHYGRRDEFCQFMEQGEHFFTYSIFPFAGFADAEKQAQELNNSLSAVIETFHKGALGTDYCGMSLSQDNIVVTALKKHEDSDAWVLRCYEAEGREANVHIRVFGTEFDTTFAPKSVKTFILSHGKVEECNFLEWNE